MVSIKIYAIVLKHKTDLINEMTEKLKNTNIDYEIFDAIYGKDLTEDFYNENNIVIDPKFRNPFTHTSMTTGEIGCALSHYYCWKKAYEENIDYPIFVESDAIFEKDFECTIKEFLNKEYNFDLLYLGRKTFTDDKNDILEINDKYKLVNPVFSYWCIGYMFSKEGTRKIVNSEFLKNLISVDDFLPIMYLDLQNQYYNRSNYSSESIHAIAIEPKLIHPKPNTFLVSETEGQPFYNYKYDNNFYENTIQAVTVGTDPVDGYKRFVDSTITYGFPYVCLGFGKPWCGNDMAKGAGGGHKVVLLKEYLQQFDDDDKRYIIFSDCYDAVLSAPPNLIISKFRELQQSLDADIIFSAEAKLWPDFSLVSQFPDVGTPYKYLNSGGFMGTIKDVKKLIQTPIESYDDDQLYYQREYLKSVKKEINLKIKLDAKAEIFQTLSSHFEHIEVNNGISKVKNKLTDTTPMVIHGNGGPKSKTFIDKLCNYINTKYRHVYGYKDNHTNLKKLNIDEMKYPKIYMTIIVDDKSLFAQFTDFFQQRYPNNFIIYHVLNISGESLQEEVNSFQKEYNKMIYITDLTNNCGELRTFYILLMSTMQHMYDYLYIGHIRHIIKDENWLRKAICSNLDVIAPMLNGQNNTYFSNFWGEVDESSGFYKRSWDYMELVERKYKGYWNVPYISSSMLIHKNKWNQIMKAIKNEYILDREVTNFDMYFCRCLQLRGIFMYISNYDNYGYIRD